ncbi:heterokaryon incompatibility protein 6, OR allele-like [Teratosphaeria destructans]|uniref:Heterokaryon incompatibility protein 6, OR allele-like n=1 Tax=Teratosphaeria destructans TaxID=418781 RepID=A0A9W7STE6_9PEZI|nr:heterokaryon incompatibility protein 6, OR allele-like [Teratosphaeria destructans]
MASRPLVLGLGTQRFAAGGGQLGLFDWQYDSGLQLSGILVDTVQAVGHVLLDIDGKHDPHALISAWWAEAASIAVTRIAHSPGSTSYTDAFEAMRRRLALCRHGYYVGEMRHRRRGSLLDDANTVMTDANHHANQTLVLGPTRGRVLFASSTGFLGLVPHGTREGDVIVIVRGVDVPYVLRPQGEAYELIGEAYVEGVMQGEALGMGFMGIDVMIR